MASITLQGNPTHTIGELPSVGTEAPDFIMTRNDLSEVRLHDCLGKITILNIFPSLDTATCAAAMQKFNDIIGSQNDVQVLCISADLPFAQQRFCAAKHLNNVIPVSIFRNTNFGKLYGVLITDGPLAGLLSRAVIVLDKQGKIVHTEQVKELADEPNYQPIIDYIKAC
jgi:thiol peroxidase